MDLADGSPEVPEGSKKAVPVLCQQAGEAGPFPASRLVQVIPEGSAQVNVR